MYSPRLHCTHIVCTWTTHINMHNYSSISPLSLSVFFFVRVFTIAGTLVASLLLFISIVWRFQCFFCSRSLLIFWFWFFCLFALFLPLSHWNKRAKPVWWFKENIQLHIYHWVIKKKLMPQTALLFDVNAQVHTPRTAQFEQSPLSTTENISRTQWPTLRIEIVKHF